VSVTGGSVFLLTIAMTRIMVKELAAFWNAQTLESHVETA
jgi:hypothetical protein